MTLEHLYPRIPSTEGLKIAEVALEALDNFLAGGPLPDRQYGLCFNLSEGVVHRLPTGYKHRSRAGWRSRDLVGTLAESWPKNSGVEGYPVPCPKGGHPAVAFNAADDCWIGEYGALRLELTQHVRDRLAALISAHKENV